jgi:hypothetical protein
MRSQVAPVNSAPPTTSPPPASINQAARLTRSRERLDERPSIRCRPERAPEERKLFHVLIL